MKLNKKVHDFKNNLFIHKMFTDSKMIMNFKKCSLNQKMSMNFKKYFTNFLKMFFDYRNVRRLKKIVLKHVHKFKNCLQNYKNVNEF